MQLAFDFPVTPRFTFENFVICAGNSTAFHFARRLLDGNTGENVLYIHGPSGSGKTHLLRAVGHSVWCGEVGCSIPYVSFREIDELYRGEYLAEQQSKLEERFRDAPALLVDDIHLIPDNAGIRVELWQVFNDFYHAGKKIVVTGLHPPRELPRLDGHLISRLQWGLVAPIDVSDDESRRLILRKLSEDRQIILPDEVLTYLLLHTRRDIHSLMGALDAVNRLSFARKRKISLRLAKEALTGDLSNPAS